MERSNFAEGWYDVVLKTEKECLSPLYVVEDIVSICPEEKKNWVNYKRVNYKERFVYYVMRHIQPTAYANVVYKVTTII